MSADEIGVEEAFALMNEISSRAYEVAVVRLYGRPGVDCLLKLMDAVKDLLRVHPPEMLTDGLYFAIPLDPAGVAWPEGGKRITNLSELSGQSFRNLTVAFTGATTFTVWESVKPEDLSIGPHIAYRYVHAVSEEVLLDGDAWPLDDVGLPCAVGAQTYSSLEEALANYVGQNRRPEMCPNLAQTWRDDRRLSFLPKPEALMRRSLALALRYTLSGVQVRPEQNQDETKPVDIEVTWWSPPRSAIIEIKWLGASGSQGSDTFSTTYAASRAIDGLKQLADYLDRRDGTTPTVPVMGYLVVFDARRRGLKATDVSISREDGLHYQLRDPEYPVDLLERTDMGRPFRCFMEPVYS